MAQLADMLEFHHRAYGVDGSDGDGAQPAAAASSTRKSSTWFVADRGRDTGRTVDGRCVGGGIARSAGSRPDRSKNEELDALLVALGDFVDLKCPFTLGHSRAVAELAAEPATTAGLDADAVALIRRAGYVHDLGRIGISNQIWSKPGPLTAAEIERVRLHPYFTRADPESGRRDSQAVAQLAGNHHECTRRLRIPAGIDRQPR